MEKRDFIDKHYYITWITAFFLLIFYVFSINTSFLYTSVLNYKNIKRDPFDGAILPIKYTLNYLTISSRDRAKKFTELDSSKFINLPKYDASILGRNISQLKAGNPDYEQTLALRTVYLTPYMGNYNHDGKEYAGSHLAIDIKAPIGTPVYAVANGVVVKVGYQGGGFGNYVLIRHDNVPLSDGTTGTIYSSYSHLDTATISEGVKVSRGDPIGTVGETGIAVGSHLHFQMDLDTAPFHPYWPFTGAEQRARAYDFFSAISNGLGKENALLYTINPMDFINKNFNSSISKSDINTLVNTNISTGTSLTQTQALVTSETQVALRDNNVLVATSPSITETKTQVDTNLDSVSTQTGLTATGIVQTASSNQSSELNLSDETNSIFSLVGLNSADVIGDDVKTETAKNYIYSDVADSDKYYNSIKYFKDLGSINGFSDGSFKPDNDVTRIESLKIILNSFKKEISQAGDSKFLDIQTGSWENNYIQKGVDLSIVDPKNTSFYPQRTINRIEALKLIILLKGIDINQYKTKDYSINDVSQGDWFYPYVVYAIENNLFSVQNGNFVPTQALTRRELVDTMYKVINLK